MTRQFVVNGETLVTCKGAAGTPIASVQQVGLSDNAIRVSIDMKHADIKVDAWGEEPPEVQFMLAEARISMSLVHYDSTIIDSLIQQSMGYAPAIGQLPRAGTLMGSSSALYSASNSFFSIGLTSPVFQKPYNFLACYLYQTPYEIPLGTEKSVIQLNFRCIPYPANPAGDPWQGGQGAAGTVLWSYTTLS